MPPRNSRIRPFKKYNLDPSKEYDDPIIYTLDYDEKTRKAVDYYKEILNPADSPLNKYNQAFEQYKANMLAKGLSAETTTNMITKSEEEGDPRYRNKDWYKLRAAGDPRGWAIDGERCDGRNSEIGRKGFRGIQ